MSTVSYITADAAKGTTCTLYYFRHPEQLVEPACKSHNNPTLNFLDKCFSTPNIG